MIRYGATTLVALAALCAACGDDSAGSGGGGSTASSADSTSTTAGAGGDAQTPPQGAANVEAWLAEGSYKSWASEPAIHASRAPSPHGFNRIYSNDRIATNATGTDPWPQGAAAVKELYDSETATAPVGVAVYLKTADDSAGGAAWYWYERVPLDSEAPHDAAGVVADGLGTAGPAKTICVGCHVAAGTDPAHTPTPNGHDQVYTPVAR